MRLILLFLFITAVVFGQVSPNPVTFGMRTNPSNIPHVKSVTVTGNTATPTVGACTNISGPANLCTQGSLHNTPQTNVVYFYFDGFIRSLAAGTYQVSFLITLAGGTCSGGCTENITLTVFAATVNSTVTNISGIWTGCTSTNTFYLDPSGDTCPITNARPGGTFNFATTPGTGYYYDPLLGGSAWSVTDPSIVNRVVQGDAIAQTISADGKLVVTADLPTGTTHITKTDGSGDLCTLPGDRLNVIFDPILPETYYYMPIASPATLKKEVACSGSPTTVITYAGTSHQLSNSGDGNPSREGYLALQTNHQAGDDYNFIVVDLNHGTYVQHAITVIGQNPRGEIQNSKAVSGATGKLWIVVTAYNCGNGNGFNPGNGNCGSNEFYSWVPGAGSITDEGAEPLPPETTYNNGGALGPFKIQPTVLSDCTSGMGCRYTQHADFVEIMVSGVRHEAYWQSHGIVSPAIMWQVAEDLDVGGPALMDTAVEAGGGEYAVMPINPAQSDVHTGCAALRPVCVFGTDGDPQLTAYVITGVTVGNPTTFTVASTTGLANGNALLMNAIGGLSNFSGVNTTGCSSIANLTATTFTCATDSTGQTWTSNTGSFIINTAPSALPHQGEAMIADLRNPLAPRIIRLMKHRTWNMNDRISGGYYGQYHPGMDPWGTMVCYELNGGVPDMYWVNCGYTGVVPGNTYVTGKVTETGKVTNQ